MLDQRAGDGWWLFALRIRQPDVPPWVQPLPWPRQTPLPSRAAEPPPPTDRPIVTRAAKATAERKRITAHRRAGLDPENLQVDPIRRANGTAIADDRVDIADLNPNRRTAKRVHGFKNVDALDTLEQAGTISRSQGSRPAADYTQLFRFCRTTMMDLI